MGDKTFSITRTKATWKPRITDDDLVFLSQDKRVSLDLGYTVHPRLEKSGRAPKLIAPYSSEADEPENDFFGNGPITFLDEAPENLDIDYKIVGGYNNNAIQCLWESTGNTAYQISWVALKTFTGMQLKYVTDKKRPPVTFALADEDAYVYCDENPCLECIFMCKRGFVLYINIENVGIVKLPLTRSKATGNPDNAK